MEKHFNKIAGKNGFYDFEDKLNYFDYFGIKGEDLENVFLLFKKYENNMHELKNNIYQRIMERYTFYTNHTYNKETKKFVKVKNDSEKRVAKALFTSVVFLGARLVSQEYVLLSTINKLIYNVNLRVFKFFNEKFNYKIYKKSLKEYYETLSTFGIFFMDQNTETYSILSNMDEYIDKDYYSLEAYKDIFLFMWMYTYIKFSCDLSDYKFKYDDSKRLYPKFNSNVLSPMDYDHIFNEVGFEQENAKRIDTVEDFRGWSLEPYYITIENQIREYYKDLMLVGTVNLNQYFYVADVIKEIYLNFSYYTYDELANSLFTEASTATDKIYTKEELDFIIEYCSLNLEKEEYKTAKVDDLYDVIYKKPLFNFKDQKGNRLLIAYPEFVWMSYQMQKEYHFFDKELSKKFNARLKVDYNPILNDQLKKVEKRFGVMKAFDPNEIQFFAESKNHTQQNPLTDCVLYDPALNRLLFVLTNFYSVENIDWLNAKRTIDTYAISSKIIPSIFSRSFSVIMKDIKKIKKQMRKMGVKFEDEENVKVEGIVFINDILNAIPKVKVNDFTVHVVGISTMEYFTNSYIYKK
ncbi:hypothetical protein [Spiroplasma endosymbiont of Diplazon laetatorius]|uniref:hypothetical protein n=1 Tax=Spiroplasma endosymbiont of Diplazon laetatorius TaxID=3066322 RepID=UPI0030CF1D19